MNFKIDDVVQFAHWTDKLGGMTAEEEMPYRAGLNLVYRIVGLLPDQTVVIRRRDLASWQGEFQELLVEAAALDFVGGPDCGADLRFDLVANARVYLRLALIGADFAATIDKFALFAAFVNTAMLTPREREIFEATTKYQLLLDAIAGDASWSDVFSLYGKPSAQPPLDLKGNVVLALHHRALDSSENLDFALAKVLEVGDDLKSLHPRHPLRRFSLPESLDEAASKLRAALAAG